MAEQNTNQDSNVGQIFSEVSASLDFLGEQVPQKPDVNIHQNVVPYQDTIDKVNTEAEIAMLDSRAKLVNLYIECEKERLNQQKPLLESVIALTRTLIWIFNVIIGLITSAVLIISIVQSDTSVLPALFDFLKYYIGAVLVELVGMLLFIVQGVFSSKYSKIVDCILPDNERKA